MFFVGSAAVADDHHHGGLTATLRGFEEVPAISTTATGSFSAQLNGNTIAFTLTYSNLEAAATAAHIHFAQRSVNGGVIAFLCGGGGKPACPASGTVSGTISASDIIGPAEQGIAAGELVEAVRAITGGVAYVNVHSSKFPNGEIRGQIGAGNEIPPGHGENDQGEDED